MPELPEVETIVRGLRKKIVNNIIKEVIIREEMLIGYPDKETFVEEINSRKILEINRRGKYIIIQLSGSKKLIIHLRMTGKLLVKENSDKLDKHTHIIFRFANGIDLRFNNMRKFGRMYLVNGNEMDRAGGIEKLGPEPLSDDFTAAAIKEKLKNRTTKIKSLLLKQDFIAGIGNIYADEILFEAGISPLRDADTITDSEIEKLYKAIKKVLKKGIEFCGTSIADYVNEKGEPGSFQEKLKVYGKSGEKCINCGHIIEKDKIGGRSSYYCPVCQE